MCAFQAWKLYCMDTVSSPYHRAITSWSWRASIASGFFGLAG
jgi:hypothetical protein